MENNQEEKTAEETVELLFAELYSVAKKLHEMGRLKMFSVGDKDDGEKCAVILDLNGAIYNDEVGFKNVA